MADGKKYQGKKLHIDMALQDQNELSQSQKRGGIKKLLKCMYMVDKPPT